MSDLKRKLIDKIISPYNESVYDTILANIVSYDNIKNRASIQFQDPKGPGIIQLDDVPVQLGSNGFKSASPHSGDQVWVSFQNKSPLNPKIVSLADERYEQNTRKKFEHIKQGAFIPDFIKDVNINNLHPAIEDYIDESNTVENKYYNFENSSPTDDLIRLMQSCSNYNYDEIGMTHPLNSSTIKIDNDGTINIFTDTNQGIKVNPKTKTIDIYGTNENIELNNINTKSISWTLNCQNDINISSDSNINLKCSKLIINGKEFKEGDSNV